MFNLYAQLATLAALAAAALTSVFAGNTFGRTVIGQTGNPIRVIADGRTDGFKIGGVSIDWTTVTPVNADTTLGDGTVVKNGDSYIPLGTVLAKITATGLYGPCQTNAADGRQTLTRGSCFVLDVTVVASTLKSNNPPVFDGGTVWRDRLVLNETVPSANNPTEASFLAAFPAIRLARD